ncbi:MAG TPA: isoprenylcysteine carboxylmethyltransferase family protein [Thermoanaerobaculia bacterium]|nr:isoprenylcysteine carboxylmethyltransferase family protein [Thermoanaerobaculia bacterium]
MTADPLAQKHSRRLSTIIFFLLVLAIVGLVYTNSLLGRGPAAVGLQIAAVTLMLWARLTFGIRSFHYAANPTEGGLVTTGPYRYMRHPIYTAILLFVWAGVASNLSPVSVALGAVVTAMLFLRMIFEEALVRQRYPEYADYARRTKRVIPFILVPFL